MRAGLLSCVSASNQMALPRHADTGGQALLRASLFLRIVDQRTFCRFSDCLSPIFVRLRIGAGAMTDTGAFLYRTSLMFYHGHLILGQRSCLIRADHLRTAERLSTAVSFRITAFRFDILVTPMKPDCDNLLQVRPGIAATARS